jgi:hypothetical protein
MVGQNAQASRRRRRIVTYCAGCTDSLALVAPTCHIGEILFEPQKALSGKSKVSKAPMTYANRILLKHRLKKLVKLGGDGDCDC